MMKEKITDKLNIVIGIYAIIFAIYSLMGRIMPLAKMVQPVNAYIYIVLAGAGMLLAALSFIMDRDIFKARYGIVLIAFIGVTAISAIVNIEYGYRRNLTTICWMIINVVLFYTMYMRVSIKTFEKWVRVVFAIMIVMWFGAVVTSIVQYVLQIDYLYEVHGQIRRQGFMEGRLFGIFNDPNYGAVTSIYMVLGSLWIIRSIKNIFVRVLLSINVTVCFIYIVLSGSRTAIICVLAVVAFLTACYVKNFLTEKNVKLLGKFTIIAILTLLSVAITYGINLGTKKVMEYCVIDIEDDSGLVPPQAGDNEAGDVNNNNSNNNGSSGSILQRPDSHSGNISNNRFDIWKGYIGILKEHKLIGLSPANQMEFVKDKYPDSYIGTTGYETHNGYLTVFVSVGIIGSIIMAVFLVCLAKDFIKVYLKHHKINENYIFVSTLIISILINAFFFTELFFVNNITTVLFYSLIGLAFEEEEEQERD